MKSALTQQRREEGSHCVVLPGEFMSCAGIVLCIHHSFSALSRIAQNEKLQS